MSNFIPPSKNGQVIELDLRDLADHALLAGIPVWAPGSAGYKGMRESIADRGLDYHLLVDNANRIVDGRNRRNVLLDLGGEPGCRPMHVRCRIVDQDEATRAVLDQLVHRRHLTKGALAYVLVPLLEPALVEIRKRRADNVRSRSSAEQTIGQTTDQLAAQYGFGREMLFQARRVRALLEKHAEKFPDLQAKIEADIFSGELGLGGAIVAITNVVVNERGRALDARAQHGRIFLEKLYLLNLHWAKASDDQRAVIREKLRESMLTWDGRLVAEFEKMSAEVAREKAHQAAESAA